MSTYKKVCGAKTKGEMQKQFGLLLKHCSKDYDGIPESHQKQQLSNVGYFAGYYDSKVRENVKKWLGAIHPIFGISSPTIEEAFKAGLKLGRKVKKERKGKEKNEKNI